MLSDVLSSIVDAKTVESAWLHHTIEMERFGFDRLLYGFTRFRTLNSLGDRDDMMVLSTHTGEYMSEFFDSDMYLNGPMVDWAVRNTGAMSWCWVAENIHDLTNAQKRVVSYNQKSGVTAGYTISFQESSIRQKGAIALTARPGLTQCDVENIWTKHGAEIHLINKVLHLKLTSMPFPAMPRKLSERQREVLEWVGDGKTTQDIATIMGLTPATVEKHLKLARNRLSVETTAQAVMKASVQRQIFVIAS